MKNMESVGSDEQKKTNGPCMKLHLKTRHNQIDDSKLQMIKKCLLLYCIHLKVKLITDPEPFVFEIRVISFHTLAAVLIALILSVLCGLWRVQY